MWVKGIVFFIQQPYARGNVLIDTGGLQKSDLATSRLIPLFTKFRVFFIWIAVFISHEDYDHCGALASFERNIFKVKKVILMNFKKKENWLIYCF